MKPNASADIWPSYYVTPKHNLDQYTCLPTYLPHLNTMNTLNLQAVQITGIYCNWCSIYNTFYILWHLYSTSYFLKCFMTTVVHVMTKGFTGFYNFCNLKNFFLIFSAHIHLCILTLTNLWQFYMLRMIEGLDDCFVQLYTPWWCASKTQNM